MILEFDWSPEYQRLAVDGVEFTHEGPPGTSAEHDVAHLMLAHNGRLHWRPVGTRDEVCFAEFNAVHLEVLLITASPRVSLEEHLRVVLPTTIPHLTWFVEKHYAPFPISVTEAMARFWSELRPARLEPLLPFFQQVRHADQTQRIVRSLNA